MCTLFQQCAVSAIAAAALLSVGCSQSATKAPASNPSEVSAKTIAPQEIVPVKAAFPQMYTAARTWAADVMLLKISAKEIPNFKNENGKAAMWEAIFASPTQRSYRVYSYAIASAPPEIHKGVVAGLKMPWNGVTREAMPVDLSLFNIDSDAAYTAATGDAGAWLKKNPGKTLSSFEIGQNSKFPTPVWFVMWGDKKSGYAAFVDANSGQILKGK
jgi:hypothetical protein